MIRAQWHVHCHTDAFGGSGAAISVGGRRDRRGVRSEEEASSPPRYRERIASVTHTEVLYRRRRIWIALEVVVVIIVAVPPSRGFCGGRPAAPGRVREGTVRFAAAAPPPNRKIEPEYALAAAAAAASNRNNDDLAPSPPGPVGLPPLVVRGQGFLPLRDIARVQDKRG